MRYYLDTEFIESMGETANVFAFGAQAATARIPPTIDLLSIGIVREDGAELYLVSAECDLERANDFVREKVIPNLDHPGCEPGPNGEQITLGTITERVSRVEIAGRIRAFVGDDPHPVFYGYYADYDWVVFCWLFGAMIDLPRGFPMYCRDLKQTVDEVRETLGIDLAAQVVVPTNEHNALVDARFNRRLHQRLIEWSTGQG